MMMRAAAQLPANSVGCMATDWALPVGILDDASCISCTAPTFHPFQTVNFHIPAASQSEAPKQMVPRPFARLAATSSLSTRVASLHRIRQSRHTQRDLLPCCSRTAVASRCSERCGFLSTDQAQLRLNMQVLDCEAMLYFQHFIQWLSARPGCAGCACQGVMDIGSCAPVVARLSLTTRGRACATDVRQQINRRSQIHHDTVAARLSPTTRGRACATDRGLPAMKRRSQIHDTVSAQICIMCYDSFGSQPVSGNGLCCQQLKALGRPATSARDLLVVLALGEVLGTQTCCLRSQPARLVLVGSCRAWRAGRCFAGQVVVATFSPAHAVSLAPPTERAPLATPAMLLTSPALSRPFQSPDDAMRPFPRSGAVPNPANWISVLLFLFRVAS
ncbi:unnamed protein product [Effrenium voratum]|uniref:Uncharacterized protein n=1 Tax=Effrenium voratum TaxID=2562239 RepID=A0AA36I6U8_9DINO|nr:unnamed protein product [Effrenium voratum]